MTTQTHPLDLAGRSVLLATDGSPAAQAATLFAAALAKRYDARIHVVTVVDTSPAPIPPPLDMALAMADAAGGQGVHERQLEALRRMISETTQQSCDWPARVKLGTPAHAIAKEAKRLGAVLVILGLRRHGMLDRAINDETVLGVIRSAACPVLGVTPHTAGLPQRIVAAVDFSSASLEAARAASAVAGDESSLVLTYVPPVMAYVPGDGEGVIHELGTQVGLERTTAELARPGLSVEHVVLPHELSHTVPKLLLDYAEGTHADLIAAGSARHSRLDRWMIGSVSTDLVRDGRTSVLIVPPRPVH
ncbi:MAG TPA: universal stress protein [Gemmatimonadaceae bacterium]